MQSDHVECVSVHIQPPSESIYPAPSSSRRTDPVYDTGLIRRWFRRLSIEAKDLCGDPLSDQHRHQVSQGLRYPACPRIHAVNNVQDLQE